VSTPLDDTREVEELIDILAAYYPGAKKAIHVLLGIQRWAKHLEYPVNSFMDLGKQVQKKPIRIDNNSVELGDITGPIPSYYFPIASYENLIEKVNELYRIKTAQQAPSLPPRSPLPPQPNPPVSAIGSAAMQGKRFSPRPSSSISSAGLSSRTVTHRHPQE
jgi:hypothetical protein